MKKLLTFIMLVLISASLFSQADTLPYDKHPGRVHFFWKGTDWLKVQHYADSAKVTASDPMIFDGVSKIKFSDGTSMITVSDATGGITSITYADLLGDIASHTLTAGSFYELTDFQTRHYFVDGAGSQAYDTEDALAPGTISLTADAVGANPVTYYYKAVYMAFLENASRSIVSTEFTCEQGDATTSLTFSCDAIPAWAVEIGIMRGTSTGNYTYYTKAVTPLDVYGLFNEMLTIEAEIEAIPIHQNISTTLSTNTGATEPLILLATSDSTLDKQAYSPAYPQDVIYYDYDSTNYLADPSFGLGGSTIIPGWKGVIYFRHDTKLDNYTGYDFRNVKFRRWSGGYPDYSADSTYAKDARILNSSDGIVYGAKAAIGTPEAWTAGNWYKIWDTSTSPYFLHTATGNSGETFADFLTWQVGSGIGNNIIMDSYDMNSYSMLTNNVFLGLCVFNSIKGSSTLNTIAGTFWGNIINFGFTYNIITSYFVANSISSNFSSNIIYYLDASPTFANNSIDNKFMVNIVDTLFQFVTTQGGIHNTNFFSSTITSGNFHKTYTTNADGDVIVVYYDAANQLVVSETL